jgi:excinuclease ABC subunit B
LIDPVIEIRPVSGQVDDLLVEIRERTKRNERVLCTTLTKRMAEDLTDYYRELGVRIRYLHSDVDTLERIDILRDLRLGEFDVLVGINLLREGLDLPEVSLVAIFDADKEGFLRSPRSLIQTIGRAARNVNGRVMMYADRITAAMKQAMDETSRRRTIQEQYNLDHGITPTTIVRAVMNINPAAGTIDYYEVPKYGKGTHGGGGARGAKNVRPEDVAERISEIRAEMFAAAENLEFEKAAKLRDELKRIEADIGGAEGALATAAGAEGFDPYATKAKTKTKGGAASGGRSRRGPRR